MLLNKVKSSRAILYIIFVVCAVLLGGYYMLGDKNPVCEIVENIVTKVIKISDPMAEINLDSITSLVSDSKFCDIII